MLVHWKRIAYTDDLYLLSTIFRVELTLPANSELLSRPRAEVVEPSQVFATIDLSQAIHLEPQSVGESLGLNPPGGDPSDPMGGKVIHGKKS